MKSDELARLFASEAPRLARRLRRFRGVPVEDVVQSAFAKMLEVNLAEIEDPRAFLARLVRNLALDEVRRQYRARLSYVSEDFLAELIEAGASSDARLELTPEERLIAGERFAYMAEVFKNLPKEERLALVMFKLLKRSHAEIGERLGISRYSVPRYLTRALSKCGRALAAYEAADSKESGDDLGKVGKDRT